MKETHHHEIDTDLISKLDPNIITQIHDVTTDEFIRVFSAYPVIKGLFTVDFRDTRRRQPKKIEFPNGSIYEISRLANQGFIEIIITRTGFREGAPDLASESVTLKANRTFASSEPYEISHAKIFRTRGVISVSNDLPTALRAKRFLKQLGDNLKQKPTVVKQVGGF